MNAPIRHTIEREATRFTGYAGETLGSNAARIDRAFAQGLRPPPKVSVSDWAKDHRHFPEDSAYPGRWRHDTAPYLVEIMDRLSPHDPCAEVAILKCAQSGGSASGENWIGYISDVAPGPLMYVQATITAAKDWLAEKFWPMVEATPRLNPARRGSVMPKRQRDGAGTTALRVRFAKGGWMLIAGANSAATLRQHSIRYAIEDDLDQFPDDLDNQGSPEGMVDARLRTFTRLGISKRLKISTGTNKGASKIGRAYEASDQRRYYLKCRCGSRFDPQFSDLEWPDGQPERAVLVAPCCQHRTQHWEKAGMSLFDGWLPTGEIPDEDGVLERPARVLTEEEFQRLRDRDMGGRQPGYHITGIITAFMTWAQLCVAFIKAQGDVNKLRTWTNLDLGDLFELKGDAPPAEKLDILREQDWGNGQVPWGPVVFTLGCDVQGDGIYGEALGHGRNAETWELDHFFLPGPTDVPGEGAWIKLEEYSRRKFVLPGGLAFGFDQEAVDAGYHTEGTKAYCKRSPRRLPVFGRDGWTLPILGRGTPISFNAGSSTRGTQARKKKAGEEAHLVGTFAAKLTFYGFLKASIAQAEAALKGEAVETVRGRVHFGRDAGRDYFDMLTSESCVTETKKGIGRRVWRKEPGRENHWLDCRIYNMAAAEALKLDSLSDHDWVRLQAERYASPDPAQGDLIALATRPTPRASSPNAAESAVAVSPSAAAEPLAESWIDSPDRNWL